MLLGIRDRLMLLNLLELPLGFSLIQLRVLNELRQSLGFTESEIADVELEQTPGGYKWNTDKDDYKAEVSLGSTAVDILMKRFQHLDKAEQLVPDHLPLYESLEGLQKDLKELEKQGG